MAKKKKAYEKTTSKATGWTATILSIAGFLISCLTATIGYLIYSHSRENVEIFRTSRTPALLLDIKEGQLFVVAEYSLTIANWSTNPTSIVNVKCETGRKLKATDKHLTYVQPEQCEVLTYDKASRIPVNGTLNLAAKQAVELILVARMSSPDAVQKRYEEFAKIAKPFNDEEFLLLLAGKGTDVFGNNPGPKYQYLQKTFGRNLCTGGSIAFTALSESKMPLNELVDFYVGRMSPVVNCQVDEPVVILYSGPYKRDLYTMDQPL
jgi:hypothetical protein